jgi:hypothetical protein
MVVYRGYIERIRDESAEQLDVSVCGRRSNGWTRRA